jgi:hypothetical protein
MDLPTVRNCSLSVFVSMLVSAAGRHKDEGGRVNSVDLVLAIIAMGVGLVFSIIDELERANNALLWAVILLILSVHQ